MRDSQDTITEQTKIPLGVVVVCFVFLISSFVGGALWISNSLHQIEMRLFSIEAGLNNNVSEREFQDWLHKVQDANPQLKVPNL